MALLEKIEFNPLNDTLYILGDAIDRGEKSIECLDFIMKTKNVHFLIGNHEQMMIDFYNKMDIWGNWDNNGNETTKRQLKSLNTAERKKIFAYIKKCPYYMTVNVNGKQYFLSHAGLNVFISLKNQPQSALIWSREDFYTNEALEDYICIFGHTPTPFIYDSAECSVWFDKEYRDKICIDCGCVYGGALAALRLDDGEIFYIKSNSGRRSHLYKINPIPDSINFLRT
jgi:serine/threonine protein phosphatase 1